MHLCEQTLTDSQLGATARRGDARARSLRRGTTLTEFAFVLPFFLLFVFALFEYGHTLMVANMVTSIAKQTAHQGSFEGVSTTDIEDFAMIKLNAVLMGGAPVVEVKDASSFELSSTDTNSVNVSQMPDIELSNAESRQLFLVHIEVPYEDVALFPPFWVRNLRLRGDSVMRRE